MSEKASRLRPADHPAAGGAATSLAPSSLGGQSHPRPTPAPRSDDPVVWSVVAAVPDPEIPVLTIEDLGVLRDVEVSRDGHVAVTITPTYSGCPAMDTIRADIVEALGSHGYDDVSVELVLSPTWTTDWMSEAGRRKLEAYGIAPPGPQRPGGPVSLALTVRCTQCGSPDTRELSRFGSTACKSLWVCNVCKEPFDHFKSI